MKKTLKYFAITLIAAGALSAIVPGAAFAAHPAKAHPNRGTNMAFGMLSNYSTSSAGVTTGTVTTPSSDVVNFTLTKKAKLVSEDGSSAPANADNVAVWLRWNRGNPLASKLEFGVNPFAVGRPRGYQGMFASDTTNSSDGSLASFTITYGRKGSKSATYEVDSSTKYFENGKATTSPILASGDKLTGRESQFTDGSRRAGVVRIHVKKQHKK